MPLDFPNSPTVNQEFTANGITWKYDGVAWNIVSGGSGFRVSSGAPSSPALGDLWYESDSGEMFIYYDNQWVSPAVLATVGTSAIGTAQLATSAVTSPKIADGAITTSKLANGPTYVTTLPTSATAVNGQEVYYVASSADNIIWHLRYNSSIAGNYKWEFIGGSELIKIVSPHSGVNPMLTNYDDLYSPAQTLTVPLAGKYNVNLTGEMFTNNAGVLVRVRISYKIGTTGAQDGDSISCDAFDNSINAVATRDNIKTFTSNNTVLTLQYRCADSGRAIYVQNNSIAVRPIAIGNVV